MTEKENKHLIYASFTFLALSLVVIMIGCMLLQDENEIDSNERIALERGDESEKLQSLTVFYANGSLTVGDIEEANAVHADALIVLLSHESDAEKYSVLYYDTAFDLPDYNSLDFAKDLSRVLVSKSDRQHVKIAERKDKDFAEVMIPAICIESNYSLEEMEQLLEEALPNIFMEAQEESD